MEFAELIKPLEQEAKRSSDGKFTNLMELFAYFVEELRGDSLMIRPIKEAEYESIYSLADSKDPVVQFIGINIINLISSKIEADEGENFIAKCFDKIYKNIRNMNLEDPLFVPSVMTWRKLFIRMKEISGAKALVNTESAQERENEHNCKLGFKSISATLFRNIRVLFDQCYRSAAQTSCLSIFDKIKSIEFVLHAMSDAMDMFPNLLKSIISKSSEYSEEKFYDSLHLNLNMSPECISTTNRNNYFLLLELY